VANKYLAALILRLIGIYWLIQGTFGLLATIAAVTLGDDRAEGVSRTFIVSVSATTAAVYPIAGVILLRFADQIAARLSTAPDSQAPVQFALKTGLCLIGVYFFVYGIHDAIHALFQMRFVIKTASAGAIDAIFIESLIKAIVFLTAGVMLLTQPTWLKSVLGKFPTESGTCPSE